MLVSFFLFLSFVFLLFPSSPVLSSIILNLLHPLLYFNLEVVFAIVFMCLILQFKLTAILITRKHRHQAYQWEKVLDLLMNLFSVLDRLFQLIRQVMDQCTLKNWKDTKCRTQWSFKIPIGLLCQNDCVVIEYTCLSLVVTIGQKGRKAAS